MEELSTTQANFSDMLRIAESAAREAGAYLLQKRGSAQSISQKALHDDLLDADLEAEQIILTRLRSETPDIDILSEEAGQKGASQDYWIVDPLDGSANFQHGSPFFGIAIALVIDHITRGGVIYLPTPKEMFTALQNQGAFLNGKRIAVSQTETLEKAIAHVGDVAKGNDALAIAEHLKDLIGLATKVSRLRMIGTAATDLVFVACGRADVLVNHATAPWDIEAGKLILLEAGGKATTTRIRDRTVAIYSNNILHSDIEHLFSHRRINQY
jgi:myo-inositol-1(or 4)-monophosphatase